MNHIFRMYKFTKFVAKKATIAESRRKGQNVPYLSQDRLVEQYAKIKHKDPYEIAHIRASCIENGYLERGTIHTYEESKTGLLLPAYPLFVTAKKGSKLLDSFCKIPFGLLEEALSEYSHVITLLFGVITSSIFTFLFKQLVSFFVLLLHIKIK